jgi:hypothetical protein
MLICFLPTATLALPTLPQLDAYRKVIAIEDWDEYFAKLKLQLKAELYSL